MEHVTITQEILKWFAGICLLLMTAFIAFGGLKGLYLDSSLKTKRR